MGSIHPQRAPKYMCEVFFKNYKAQIFQDRATVGNSSREFDPAALPQNGAGGRIPQPIPDLDLVQSCQRQSHNSAGPCTEGYSASPVWNGRHPVPQMTPASGEGCLIPPVCSTHTAHLFAVLELPPEALKHPGIHLLWRTSHSFDVQLENAFQEVVDLCIVVIVVPGGGESRTQI